MQAYRVVSDYCGSAIVIRDSSVNAKKYSYPITHAYSYASPLKK